MNFPSSSSQTGTQSALPLPTPSSPPTTLQAIETPVSGSAATRTSASAPKRSPAWSDLEEETLIQIYKDEVEGLRKKGKRGQTMWAMIAGKLEESMKEFGCSIDRTPQKVKEKFFNLMRRYKQAKDKIKTSGAGSEDMETCPHFDVLDEFMGSRDIVNPRFVLETASETSESGRSTPSPAPSTSSLADEVDSRNNTSGEKTRNAQKDDNAAGKDVSKNGGKSGKATRKRKRQSGQTDDDPWLALFRESQEREEKMMEALERSENNFKDLFLSAIKEFGKMVK